MLKIRVERHRYDLKRKPQPVPQAKRQVAPTPVHNPFADLMLVGKAMILHPRPKRVKPQIKYPKIKLRTDAVANSTDRVVVSLRMIQF